jgi:hypothetical protein
MISVGRFETGLQGAVTDGKAKVTFDTPSDFLDWLEERPDLDLAGWQWAAP